VNEPQHDDRPHLPGPSLYPFAFAAGVACILVGLIVNPLVIAPIGAAIAIIFGFLWARDATMEFRHGSEQIEPERGEPVSAATTAPPTVDDAAMPQAEPDERFPRNKFLEASTLGLGAVIGGLITVPVVGFMVVPAFKDQGYPNVDLGPLDNFTEGKWFVTSFFMNPESDETETSRRTAYIRNNGLLDNQPSFTIISNRCAHLGCPVQPNGPVQDDQQKLVKGKAGQRVTMTPTIPAGGFGCPCHGGQYDPEGNRTSGPPVRALDRYEYAIVNGHLVLGKPYSVSEVDGEGKNAQIHAYKLAGPGQHVDGWEQIMYPIQPPH
jgi:Rieske Fe-S protein